MMLGVSSFFLRSLKKPVASGCGGQLREIVRLKFLHLPAHRLAGKLPLQRIPEREARFAIVVFSRRNFWIVLKITPPLARLSSSTKCSRLLCSAPCRSCLNQRGYRASLDAGSRILSEELCFKASEKIRGTEFRQKDSVIWILPFD